MPDGYTFPNKRIPRPRTQIHIDLIKAICDRDRAKLNDWEKRFLISIVGYSNPSPRQLETVRAIVAKALTKGNPKRTPRRKRMRASR
jgi:hypothetical protein